MSRRAIATSCTILTALFLVCIGILHSMVNVSGMQRAVVRGDIPPRLGAAIVANAAFSGAAMSMLGFLLVLVLPGLRAGSRQACRVAAAIGIFFVVAGVAGFIWSPKQPQVLVFALFGVLVAVPAIVWHWECSNT